MLKKLSFEIQETPELYNFNGEITTSETHKCIITDSGDQLSTMKKSYNPMKNVDFMESVDRMQSISGFKNHGYSEFKGGKVVFAHLKNDKDDLKIGGHKIEDYLVMGTSHDGSYPFFFGTTTKLIRCQNQFSEISRVERVRHTTSAPKKREELFLNLEIYFQQRAQMYRNFEKLRKVKVDKGIIQMAEDYLLQVKTEDRLDGNISTRKQNRIDLLHNDILTEMSDLGENAWALFNGVTRFTTHNSPKSTEKTFGNLLGTPAHINKRALSFVNELV